MRFDRTVAAVLFLGAAAAALQVAVALGAAPPPGPREAPPPSADAQTLRVMTFNILTAGSDGHVGPWEKRKAAVVARIRQFRPDLLGTQEVLASQAEYLRQELPEYGWAGAGRDDGAATGPQTAVFWRLDRFEKIREGHFWLSKTPDVPGSKDWLSWVPRTASWVELRRRDDPRQTLLFFNTHFDALSGSARRKSAALLRERISQEAGGRPVVVTGDFNAQGGADVYRRVLGDGEDAGLRLLDSYREVHPARGTNEGTYRFPGGLRVDRRLDWILHTPHFRAAWCGIDTASDGGRYPSDHFPVMAVLTLEPPAQQ
ncbi:MAG: endonuclease/exonuclease/phosphatase family protein [Planctomycetes bacterium]|nr:endonuclease/exonuclease/phosphatase family protein [Planctomycetota bacterium]